MRIIIYPTLIVRSGYQKLNGQYYDNLINAPKLLKPYTRTSSVCDKGRSILLDAFGDQCSIEYPISKRSNSITDWDVSSWNIGLCNDPSKF